MNALSGAARRWFDACGHVPMHYLSGVTGHDFTSCRGRHKIKSVWPQLSSKVVRSESARTRCQAQRVWR